MLSRSPMARLLISEVVKVWDKLGTGTEMNTFWNSYCVGPWDNWSLGLFDCMLCTPSQQTQESWHKQLMVSKIPNMLLGSTEYLFKETLPQLIAMDGIQIPSTLPFHVPALPRGMMQKALWYVEHQTTHVHAVKLLDSSIGYFILRKDNPGGFKKLDQRLKDMYLAALNGEKDKRIKSLDQLENLVMSIRLVANSTAPWGVVQCEANTANLDCFGCKGFKTIPVRQRFLRGWHDGEFP